MIMEDGVGTGDLSGQSGDHGVTTDPNGLERIEVVRGPATLLYGSNAVGGVVNAITPHESFRDSLVPGTRGQFNFDGGTANEQAGTSASVQHGRGHLTIWASGGARRTDDTARLRVWSQTPRPSCRMVVRVWDTSVSACIPAVA